MKAANIVVMTAALVTGLMGLGRSAESQNPAVPEAQQSQSQNPPAAYPATTGDQSVTSLSGTVKNIEKMGDGSCRLEVQDSMGDSSAYTVPKNTEVRDIKDQKAAISKVKKGSAVTLSLKAGQVTKISLNS